MVDDPADYRWSSYGEAVGGGRGAAKAQSGLARALRGHKGHDGTSRAWAQGGLSKEYRRLLLTNGTEQSEQCSDGKDRIKRKGIDRKASAKERAHLEKSRLKIYESQGQSIVESAISETAQFWEARSS